METERLHCMRRIISELTDVEWPSVIGRSAHPSVIKQDQLIRRREPIDQRKIPVSNGRSEPVQHEKWWAIPNTTISDLRAIDWGGR
jgi:hypothetical protein